MSEGADANNDANIEIWKIKKLIKSLEMARGNGTSMISLILPPKDQISRAAKMLADEFGTASNIKSRVNRLSVLSAITSTQQRLKLFTKVPPNGLVIYCGTILTDDNKEKKVNIDFEPFKPINTSLYLCDNKFHTEALQELLESDDKFGFIVMDGNGSLFGTLAGNTREILHKFSVDLPKKHGRGGQSALRFARLRLEKRHNYVRKVAETATQMFITNDKVNVAGIVLAGSADFKNDLAQSDIFDQRLVAKVLKTVDVSYGGENGFNQAIELSSETLTNVKFVQEKKLISKYFEEISQDTGKFCFGIKDTLTSGDGCGADAHSLRERADDEVHAEECEHGRGEGAAPTEGWGEEPGQLRGGRRCRARDNREGAARRVVRELVQELRRRARVCVRPLTGGLAVRQGVRRCRRHLAVQGGFHGA